MSKKETEILILINYCLKLHLLKIHAVLNFQHKLMEIRLFFKITQQKCQFAPVVVVLMDLISTLFF